jgi:hypothetical protein
LSAAFTTNTSSLATTIGNLQAAVTTNNQSLSANVNTLAGAFTSNSGALASRIDSVSVTTNSRINAKKLFRQTSTPLYANMFPPGLQACPVANLDDSTMPGISIYTNTGLSQGLGYDLGGWTLADGHTIYSNLVGNLPPSSAGYYFFDINSFGQSYNIVAGKTYEFSAYTGAHRCHVFAIIDFYNSSWGFISSVSSFDSGGTGANNAEKAGGASLTDYKRVGCRGVAPAGATRAVFIIRGDNNNNGSGGANPYIFVTRPYFGIVPSGQTGYTDWQPFDQPGWYDTDDNNKFYTWSGIYGAEWVSTDDSRISASISQSISAFNTANNIGANWAIQANVNNQTGGLFFSGVKAANGTGAVYNLDIVSNVNIYGNLVVAGTIDNPQLADYSVTHSAYGTGTVTYFGQYGWADTGDIVCTIRRNSRVVIMFHYMPRTIDTSFSDGVEVVGGIPRITVFADDSQIFSKTDLPVIANTPSYFGSFASGVFSALPFTDSFLYIGGSGGGNRIRGGNTSSSTQNSSSYAATYAFDDSKSSAWRSFSNTTTEWITYYIEPAQNVGSYYVQALKTISFWESLAGITSNPNAAPKNWTLRGSNNNSTWTTLDTVTNQTGWSEGEKRLYVPETFGNYNFFRIDVSQVNGSAPYVEIAGVEFWQSNTLISVDEADIRFRANLRTSNATGWTTYAPRGELTLYITELSR